MKKIHYLLLSSLGFSLAMLSASNGFAGGAFSTTNAGQPVLWQGPVTYRIESGPIKGATPADGGGTSTGGGSGGGCSLTKNIDVLNPQGVDIVHTAFATWKAVANSSIDIEEGPSLGVDVNFDNLQDFWVGSFFPTPPTRAPAPGENVPSNASAAGCYDSDPNTPCLNSIIFDNSNVPERSLVDAIQGKCARFDVLAFAAILPQQDSSGNITSAALKSSQMVVSGACLPPVIAPDPSCSTDDEPRWNDTSCPNGGITLDELQGTVTHEVGHFLGLDHTLVNKQNYIDCKTGAAACVPENIPTMIGFFIPGANLNTLHYDDKVTFAKYYPAATHTASGVTVINGTCTLSGKVFRSNGTTQQRCEEVVAKLNNDPSTTAGMVAGAEVARNSTLTDNGDGTNSDKPNQDCADAANCSNFEIRGLTPGNYTIGVHNFSDNGHNSALSSFVLEPCHPALTSASVGDNESSLINVNCPVDGAVTNLVVKAN